MGAAKLRKAAADTTRVSAPQAIAWPALPTPAQRSQPLEIDELLASQILLLHGFFPAKTCTAWTTFLKDPKYLLLEPSPPAKKGEAARTNHRFSVVDQAFADALWADIGLQELVLDEANARIFTSSAKPGAKPVGLNPNIRVRIAISSLNSPSDPVIPVSLALYTCLYRWQIYRYEPGQAFAPHYDDTVKVGKNHTEWTLLVYLSGSDEVEGGETAFYPCGVPPTSDSGGVRKRKIRPGEEDVVVDLRKGLALLHRHGRECLLHEGRPVLKGTKWVLRSDVVLA